MVKRIESLSYDDATATGRKIVQLIEALKEVNLFRKCELCNICNICMI